MSTIGTSCFVLPPEQESGAGEMNCYKLPASQAPDSSQAIASDIMSDILNNAFDVIMGKQLQPLPPKTDQITPTVVGDILNNILFPEPTAGESNQSYLEDETALLDDEMKKIINEMKFPVEPKNPVCTSGVGDQLSDKSAEIKPNKILAEPMKRDTLERKNRLTNLVRNQQTLVKFVNSDNENDVRMAKSEEIHEQLLKVIDLEGDVEPGSSSATGILGMPPESTLHMIDLDSHTCVEGEVDSPTATEKFENQTAGFSGRGNKVGTESKKKWNFGAKIMKYIKKNGKSKKNKE